MSETARNILIAFLSVDAAVLLTLLILRIRRAAKRRQIRHYGDRAEEAVRVYVKEAFPGAVLMNDLFLETGRSVTQLDHILLCKWGVYVIETKSHNGRINTGKREWVQIYGEKVVRFHSPVLQNENHRKALVRALQGTRYQDTPVKGLVVFTSKKVHFSHRPEGVLLLEEVAPYIKSGGENTRARRVAVTARRGMKYLTRSEITGLEKCIRRASVRSKRTIRSHEKTVRDLDRKDFGQ